MKRLIIIQNDVPGTGKSTLSECLDLYLNSFRVPHHRVALVETANETSAVCQLEASTLRRSQLIAQLDLSDLVILEIESGLAELFSNFYQKNELDHLLPELGFELAILVPVTSDRESFDGVTEAAEIYSDSAQYLIVHTPTSSCYDGEESTWERSYAARVMDMFEAADIDMPAADEALELKLKLAHADLPKILHEPNQSTEISLEISKWFRRVSGQFDTARNYLFGDAFRPTIAHAPEVKKRTRTRLKTAA